MVVTDINWTYCGNHSAIYTNIDSSCCILKSNIILYVNCTSKKKVSGYYRHNCASPAFTTWKYRLSKLPNAPWAQFGSRYSLPSSSTRSLLHQTPTSTARFNPLQEPLALGPVSAPSLTRRPWLGPRGAHRPAPGPGSFRQMRSRGRRQTRRGPKRGTARAAAATRFAPSTARRSPTCFPQTAPSLTARLRHRPASARLRPASLPAPSRDHAPCSF